MVLEEKICGRCKKPFRPKIGKAVYCSDRCRQAAFKAATKEAKPIKQPKQPKVKQPLPQIVAPFTEVLVGVSLEQFRHFMTTYPDQGAIKTLCREILGVERAPASIPQQQVTLPSRAILNPGADVTKQMVEAAKGTMAYYLRNGKWGDGRDELT